MTRDLEECEPSTGESAFPPPCPGPTATLRRGRVPAPSPSAPRGLCQALTFPDSFLSLPAIATRPHEYSWLGSFGLLVPQPSEVVRSLAWGPKIEGQGMPGGKRGRIYPRKMSNFRSHEPL